MKNKLLVGFLIANTVINIVILAMVSLTAYLLDPNHFPLP